MGFNPFTSTAALGLQAATPVAGFALQNGTPSILTWTTPNDGKQHRFLVLASLDVTSAETGGQVTVTYNTPDGGAGSHTLFSANTAGGVFTPVASFMIICEANTTVTIAQATALTVGAATVWAEIWGS
jgi:hypothetical protein